MAKLILLVNGKPQREFKLDKERVTIGRRPSSDIVIDNLAVSGEHALIVTLGTDSFLEDLNSTNGTLVNKKNIKKYVLQDMDIIEFGSHQLLFLIKDDAHLPSAFANVASDKAASENQLSNARLRFLNGTEAGQELLLDRTMVKLGSPSKQLAMINKRPHGFFISHIEGNQRPLVNGLSIGLKACALKDGDEIQLGESFMKFLSD